MLSENSPKNRLPQINPAKRKAKSPELEKVKRIHKLHERDWARLESKIQTKHQTKKSTDDNSFMREMWAFRDYSRNAVKGIQDTSMFKLRRETTMKKLYLKRLDELFKNSNSYLMKNQRHKANLSSLH